MEAPASGRLFREGLVWIPCRESLKTRELLRLIEIDGGERRAKSSACKGRRHFRPGRKGRIKVSRRMQPPPFGLTGAERSVIGPQPLVFLLQTLAKR